MAGELIPLVMIPRYTSYIGPGEYATAPMEASAYNKAILAVWIGYVRGSDATPTGATWELQFQGSQDADTWTDISYSGDFSSGYGVVEMDLEWKWYRAVVTLTGNSASYDCAATCWAVGSFERREA